MNISLRCIVLCSMLVASCSLLQVSETVQHHGEVVAVADVEGCLQCHDDMKEHSHPVMVDYPVAGAEKGYAPLAEVEQAGIRIVEGRVTCVACHDVSNAAPGHPIRNLESSELCLACHIK